MQASHAPASLCIQPSKREKGSQWTKNKKRTAADGEEEVDEGQQALGNPTITPSPQKATIACRNKSFLLLLLLLGNLKSNALPPIG